MAGTAIVAVRQAVIDGIDPLLDNVSCSLTWKQGARDREQVFTTRARFNHAPASMKPGRTFRDENGTFDLVVVVQGVGNGMDETATRAVAIGTVVEEFIANNRSTLGVAGVNWITVDGAGELTELYDDRSTRAILRYSVTYNARLT